MIMHINKLVSLNSLMRSTYFKEFHVKVPFNGIAKRLQCQNIRQFSFAEGSLRHSASLKHATISNYVKLFYLYYTKQTVPREISDLANILAKSKSDSGEYNKKELIQILNLFYKKGHTIEEIKGKYLEYLESPYFSYLKIKLLTEMRSSMSSVLPLLAIPTSTLRLIAKRSNDDKSALKDSDRISYLSYQLELSETEMIKLLCKHPTLLTMQFSRLDHKMKILKNAKISSEYIVKDLWIFNYNEKLLNDRIKAALSSGIAIKPWLLRCPEKVFRGMLEKWINTQEILNGVDKVSYLAKKLQCSKDYIAHMMDKNKLLRTINIPKLEKVINFLYNKGYTPEEVRLFPRVFCSSVDTLSKRFEEFRVVKGAMPTMSQLCFSSKKYAEFLSNG